MEPNPRKRLMLALTLFASFLALSMNVWVFFHHSFSEYFVSIVLLWKVLVRSAVRKRLFGRGYLIILYWGGKYNDDW